MAHTVARTTVITRLRHPNRHHTREWYHDWLARQFTDGWTPEAMRAAELTLSPSAPVADVMERQKAGVS